MRGWMNELSLGVRVVGELWRSVLRLCLVGNLLVGFLA